MPNKMGKFDRVWSVKHKTCELFLKCMMPNKMGRVDWVWLVEYKTWDLFLQLR